MNKLGGFDCRILVFSKFFQVCVRVCPVRGGCVAACVFCVQSFYPVVIHFWHCFFPSGCHVFCSFYNRLSVNFRLGQVGCPAPSVDAFLCGRFGVSLFFDSSKVCARL